MENLTVVQKIKLFFKRFGYFIVLGLILLTLVITFVLIGVNARNRDEITEPVSVQVSPFMPVLNASIYKGYYGDELVYNESLKQWETHNGIDFAVATGSKVYSILDGKVSKVYSNVLDGTVVVIKHNNGLESSYGSLDENVLVKVGDDVSRGETIGVVSNSSSAEASAGSHLHFSMTDEGKKIDPASYLNISTK